MCWEIVKCIVISQGFCDFLSNHFQMFNIHSILRKVKAIINTDKWTNAIYISKVNNFDIPLKSETTNGDKIINACTNFIQRRFF